MTARRFHPWRLELLAALGLALVGAFRAQASPPAKPIVVLAPDRSSYRLAADALTDTLRQQGHECLRIELPRRKDVEARKNALQRLIDAQPTVIAAAGADATSLALRTLPNVPVVYFMVPNVLDADFSAKGKAAPLAGVTTDIEPQQRIRWLHQVNPAARKVAVLHSGRTTRTAQAIMAASTGSSVHIVLIEAVKDEFPDAIERLNAAKCDGVLMIPDAHLYNSATVQRLLLWGVRNKKTVCAFSSNLVKAGALTAQFPHYDAVGRQAARLVLRIANGDPPPENTLRYPHEVARAVNEHTAKMIGVSLRDVRNKAVIRLGSKP